MMRYLGYALVGSILVLAACGDDDGGLPAGSEGGPCYGNGTCDGDLVCSGSDICVAMDPCTGQTCSDHGACVDNAGTAECDCDLGYHAVGLTCVEDATDPCEGVTCSDHGTCVDNAGTAECDCDPGYRASALECLYGEYVLSGTFTITENLTDVNGDPYTHAFDGVVGEAVDFLVAFNVDSSSTSEDPMTFDRQLNVVTTGMHVEFTGPGATAIDMVQASLEGQPFNLTLSDSSGTGGYTTNLVGLEAAEYFGLELSVYGVQLPLDGDGFPVLGSVASSAGNFYLRRYVTPFDMTDYASGEGTCQLD